MEEILSEAKEREKDYEWAKAAKLCKRALSAAGKEDFLKKGQIQEKIGGRALWDKPFQRVCAIFNGL